MDHYNNLVNLMGYAAANLIFIAKLYILRERTQNISSSKLE
jgi:hypothetical protein